MHTLTHSHMPCEHVFVHGMPVVTIHATCEGLSFISASIHTLICTKENSTPMLEFRIGILLGSVESICAVWLTTMGAGGGGREEGEGGGGQEIDS